MVFHRQGLSNRAEDLEQDDFPFMTDAERAEALGIGVEHMESEDDGPGLDYNHQGPVVEPQVRSLQPPVPGWIEVRLAQVARSRGVVNPKGNFAGHVSVTGLSRGTSLAPSTIMPLLRSDPEIGMIAIPTLVRLCDFLKCTPGDLMRYHSGIRPRGANPGRSEQKRRP